MKQVLIYLWDRRTTAFGYTQVIIGVLAVSDGIFPPSFLKYLVLFDAILLACLGHYNNRKLQT
jgi:hypothetical protein